MNRSWRSRLLEFALWAIVSIGTSVILILLSEKLLPSNF
jgi:hypothetical protein